MAQPFYIDVGGKKEGPHDLITLMRRIRTGKIKNDTGIYVGDAATPVPAGSVEDIADFFPRSESAPAKKTASARASRAPSIIHLLQSGWRFTINHSIVTVFSGSFLILSILLVMAFYQRWNMPGVALAAAFIFLMHQLYLVFMLRLYRGQVLGAAFYNQLLGPVLGAIIISSALLSAMILGGLVLLLIPGILVAIFYVFVPFLIIDRRYSTVEAMHGSRLLLMKHGWDYLGTAASLVWLHILAAILVLPMMLTLPIFAGALAELYEEISNS